MRSSCCDGFTVWFTGMSGSGKTTIAAALAAVLRADGLRVELLDGDEVRRSLSPDLGFTPGDRQLHLRRLAFLASVLSRNGVAVLVAAIAPYTHVRQEIRSCHECPFVEVFVDCPLEILIERDTKGLYAKAVAGEIAHFTGISDPYERPISAEIHLRTEVMDVAQCVETVVTFLDTYDRLRLSKQDRTCQEIGR